MCLPAAAPIFRGPNLGGKVYGGFSRVCDDEDEDEDKENDYDPTKGLNNSVAQRLFIGGSTRPRTPPSSAAGNLIMIMPRPRME